MLIAAWNLNNRVGRVPFRPEAAQAAVALGADVIVLNEFYPAEREAAFREVLSDAGWVHQLMSTETGVKANRVLIASRIPFEPLELELPAFDQHFPANIAAVWFPDTGLRVVGLRVPAYTGEEAALVSKAWDWIEATAEALRDRPAVLVGDFNTSVDATGARARPQWARILASGWRRAEPIDGPSYFGSSGNQSEIDHLLATWRCKLERAAFVRRVGGYCLAGEEGALSDHAVLACEVGVVD